MYEYICLEKYYYYFLNITFLGTYCVIFLCLKSEYLNNIHIL